MDREKRKQLLRLEIKKENQFLRLEKENPVIYKKKQDLYHNIKEFKHSLSDNPTDEELDKLIQLEDEYEILNKKWHDNNDKCMELYEILNKKWEDNYHKCKELKEEINNG